MPTYLKPAKKTFARHSGGHSQGTAQDIEILTRLNIAKRAIGLYPDGHPEASHTVDNAHEVLKKRLNNKGSMLISQFDKSLAIDKQEIDPGLAAGLELASELCRHDINSVRFKKGLPRTELKAFLLHLSGDPQPERLKKPIMHIEIHQADYGRFVITPQSLLMTDQEDSHAPGRLNPAAYFLSGLSRKTSKTMGSASVPSPTKLASALNRGEVRTESVLDAFDTMLSSHFTGKNPLAEPQTQTVEDQPASKNLSAFLYGLNPKLRKQFLSLTYKHCSQTDDDNSVETLLTGLDNYLILKMIEQANEDGTEISPGLFGMVKKVVQTLSQDELSPPEKDIDDPEPGPGNLESLTKRERYETYVETDYDSILERLSGKPYSPRTLPADINIPFHEKLLEEKQLDLQVARMMLGLMKTTQDPEEYDDLSAAIVGCMDSFAATGSILLILRCTGLLRHHAKKHPVKEIQNTASTHLERFLGTAWLARLVILFEQCKGMDQRRLTCLFLGMGQPALQAMLRRVSHKAGIQADDPLVKMIAAFGESAISAIKSHRRSADPSLLKNFAVLLSAIPLKASETLLLDLYNYKDQSVSLKALESLFNINTKKAEVLLQDQLMSSDDETSSWAIYLSGKMRLEIMVPALIAMIRISFLNERRLRKNKLLIRALGEIGNIAALPVLTSIIDKRLSLFPNHLLDLKLEVYQSLVDYEAASARLLLEQGCRSGTTVIRDLCCQLTKTAMDI